MNRRAGGLRVAVALAVSLSLALALAGCGVPDGTEVRVDGPLPEAGSPETSDEPISPPGPNDATSASLLVDYFLNAAAADPEDPERDLREFIHSDEQAAWQPDPQVVVVDVVEDPVSTEAGETVRVGLAVREVGVLTKNGVIEPRNERRDYTLEVVQETDVTSDDEDVRLEVGEPRFRLVNAPDKIMLSTQALERYLLPRPVYFWDSDREVLVPDLRWLPSALGERQRAQKLMEWLEDGPSPWLQNALLGLPEDVAMAGNVVWEDQLVVSLTAAAGEMDATMLDAQVWWTLSEELDDSTLVVSIDGQERVAGGDYRDQNRTARAEPARFAVLDGVVRQFASGEELTIEAFADGGNSEVQSAAVTRDGRSAALVRAAPDGPSKLVIARPGKVDEVDLPATELGRPVWLSGEGTGLIIGDGELYRFERSGDASRVSVPGELGHLDAVAVSPDGRRLALVADGRLHMAALVWRDESFSVTDPRALATTATNLAGVAFLQENWLAIVGQADSQYLLYEITVDGAHEQQLLSGTVGDRPSVDSFTAFPGDPATAPAARGEIMYETEGRAYLYAFGQKPKQLEASDLYGDTDGGAGDPQAPFFLD